MTEENKRTSRKWIVTIWAMTMGSVLLLLEFACIFMDKQCPDGINGIVSLLFSTGIFYIGGNVWQKQINSKEVER